MLYYQVLEGNCDKKFLCFKVKILLHPTNYTTFTSRNEKPLKTMEVITCTNMAGMKILQVILICRKAGNMDPGASTSYSLHTRIES
jgi:hypothetical protein